MAFFIYEIQNQDFKHASNEKILYKVDETRRRNREKMSMANGIIVSRKGI